MNYTKEQIAEIIRQVIHNPQVISPPISYKITDVGHEEDYTSEYIDIGDFKGYVKRLEETLNNRFL